MRLGSPFDGYLHGPVGAIVDVVIATIAVLP